MCDMTITQVLHTA